VFGVVSTLVLGSVIIMGSLRMRQLENYRVAATGAIAGIIVALPALPLALFPVWALMVLYRPDVRAAFSVVCGGQRLPQAE
jgi:hypothetical protein